MRGAALLAAGLLWSSPAPTQTIRVDQLLPNARAVHDRLPSAVAAVEERLGPCDWSGLTILAESAEGRRYSSVPDWAAAFALPARGIIVLRPDRIGGYPQGSLGTVLTHELAHVAIGRRDAAARLPRWFQEGLAMSVASELGPTDMYHVSLALLFGPSTRLADLDLRFEDERSEVEAAYALSLSFLSWLSEESGSDAARRILDEAAAGNSFESAVSRATGRSLDSLESSWAREVVLLYRWVPILTSTVTLWVGITLLVLVAWARKRRRALEIRARWEREDLELDSFDNSGPHGPH